MDRARLILKVGAIAICLVILVPLLAKALYESPEIIDLVWKVLVLILLVDISQKLRSRKRSNTHGDQQ